MFALLTCSVNAVGFVGKKCQAYSSKSHWSMMRRTVANSGVAAISCDDGACDASVMNPMDLPLSKPALISEKCAVRWPAILHPIRWPLGVLCLGLDADQLAVFGVPAQSERAMGGCL